MHLALASATLSLHTSWSILPQNALDSEPLNVTFKELELKDVNYEAEVTNAGKVGGATSVLVYITSNIPGAPMKQLFSFQKIYLNPGETKKLFFSATAETLKLVNDQVSLPEVWLSVDIIIPCVYSLAGYKETPCRNI